MLITRSICYFYIANGTLGLKLSMSTYDINSAGSGEGLEHSTSRHFANRP
jgi:hypothetical protein